MKKLNERFIVRLTTYQWRDRKEKKSQTIKNSFNKKTKIHSRTYFKNDLIVSTKLVVLKNNEEIELFTQNQLTKFKKSKNKNFDVRVQKFSGSFRYSSHSNNFFIDGKAGTVKRTFSFDKRISKTGLHNEIVKVMRKVKHDEHTSGGGFKKRKKSRKKFENIRKIENETGSV